MDGERQQFVHQELEGFCGVYYGSEAYDGGNHQQGTGGADSTVVGNFDYAVLL